MDQTRKLPQTIGTIRLISSISFKIRFVYSKIIFSQQKSKKKKKSDLDMISIIDKSFSWKLLHSQKPLSSPSRLYIVKMMKGVGDPIPSVSDEPWGCRLRFIPFPVNSNPTNQKHLFPHLFSCFPLSNSNSPIDSCEKSNPNIHFVPPSNSVKHQTNTHLKTLIKSIKKGKTKQKKAIPVNPVHFLLKNHHLNALLPSSFLPRSSNGPEMLSSWLLH